MILHKKRMWMIAALLMTVSACGIFSQKQSTRMDSTVTVLEETEGTKSPEKTKSTESAIGTEVAETSEHANRTVTKINENTANQNETSINTNRAGNRANTANSTPENVIAPSTNISSERGSVLEPAANESLQPESEMSQSAGKQPTEQKSAKVIRSAKTKIISQGGSSSSRQGMVGGQRSGAPESESAKNHIPESGVPESESAKGEGAKTESAKHIEPESKGTKDTISKPDTTESTPQPSVPVLPEESPLHTGYVLFHENSNAEGVLVYPAGKSPDLEEAYFIGKKESGENSGKKIALEWKEQKNRVGELEKVKTGIAGQYELLVETKEDFVLQDVQYGKLRFIVPIRIE